MNAPNIIYILADDMGYGDMRCNGADSAIPTPNLDRLAARGMRFTDAHATTAVCTPSRYTVLTGRYAWRSRLKQGIVWEYDGPLLEPDRPTVASFLRENGYATACFGKWHLGWDWPTTDGRAVNETIPYGKGCAQQRQKLAREKIDFAGRLGGGPVDRGFDSYFGVDVPNFAPYTWFVNDRLDPLPTVEKPEELYGRPGPATEGWTLEAMIPEFTRRVVDYIEDAGQQGSGKPFFLYYPLTSPHSPIVPNAQFIGASGVSLYGDFICEVDWVVGQVIDALDRTGLAENTLLIFTSDNGPEDRTSDDEGAYTRAQRTGHFSMGPLRGIKRDAWEGGHRMPFLAAWPGTIPEGSVCDRFIGHTDLFATCAEIIGRPVPDGAAEDSISFLPLLKGRTDTPTREELVYHSMSGKFALRRGDWVFIDAPCGGDIFPEPDWFRELRGYVPHEHPGELFNLRDDLPERVNRYGECPDLVAEMTARLREIQGPDAPADTGPPADRPTA